MIKVDHEFSDEIMNYLSEYEGIKGDEDHLIDTWVWQTIAISGIWTLEEYINDIHDESIDFSNLRFIKA